MRICASLALTAALCGTSAAADRVWTATVRAADIVVGQDLLKLTPRRAWLWEFRDGRFEVAVRKSAIPVPAPQCRREHLILAMPSYYPENPAQAPLEERRAVYDALLELREAGKGSLKIRFDALWYVRETTSGPELTGCNIYFTLPLEKDAARILP